MIAPFRPAPAGSLSSAADAVGGAAARAVTSAASTAASATSPTPVALARGEAAGAIGAAGLAGFLAVFGLVRTHRTEAVDLAWLLRLQRWRHPVLARLMAAASWPGFPPQSRLLPPILIGLLWVGRLRVEATFQVLGWATGAISTGIKALMKRPRPVAGTDLRVVAAPLGGSSFPSGHVITYMGTYGFAAYLAHTLIRPARVRHAVVAGLVGLLALVGPSRIQEGHHWPTDVLASYLLGTSYLVVLVGLYRRAKARLGPAEDASRGASRMRAGEVGP